METEVRIFEDPTRSKHFFDALPNRLTGPLDMVHRNRFSIIGVFAGICALALLGAILQTFIPAAPISELDGQRLTVGSMHSAEVRILGQSSSSEVGGSAAPNTVYFRPSDNVGPNAPIYLLRTDTHVPAVADSTGVLIVRVASTGSDVYELVGWSEAGSTEQ